jgi:hypothetical protein
MNKIKLIFTCEIVTFKKGKQFSDDEFQEIVNSLTDRVKAVAAVNEFLTGDHNLTLEWKR